MLDYQNAALLELTQEDGLLIMAKGLGLEHIVLSILKLYSDPGNLVLVIGASSKEMDFFIDQLEADGIKPLPKVINSEVSITERQLVYLQGGVQFITSRILVVDMLKNTAPIESITGIIVLKAHKVIDSCQEAFILRLYREKNKTGFIKAVTSNPDAFTRGFCRVERVMRNLFVKKLYLWPRFHVTVNDSFEHHNPQVTEIQLSLTKPMLAIQTAVLELIAVCVRELRSRNPTLDLEEVTTENAISKAFDKIIRFQLEPVWDMLNSKTIRYINDLKELRSVLTNLTQYDCATFYNVVESLKSMDKVMQNPGWILLPSAETLFMHTKERIFGSSNKKRKSEKNVDAKKQAVPPDKPVLEESPKWLALKQILSEIVKENVSAGTPPAASRVLIVASDDRTCDQLKEFLCVGGEKLLQRLYDKYLKTKGGTKTKTENGPPAKKKKNDNSENDARNKDSLLTLTQLLDLNTGETNDDKTKVVLADSCQNDILKEITTPVIVIEPLRGSAGSFGILQTLHELKPRFIIMYDADMTFVRQVEVYQASNPDIPVLVYIMVYENSAEEQRYLTVLRREKEAFEMLIHQKGSMVIPEERDGRVDGHPDLERNNMKANETVGCAVSSTRIGGIIQEKAVQQKVIVDMREFRSELPSLIHRRGIDIEPVTLEVGDYILTPDMCVERKSVSDLIGSLNSGRLYTQATAMCRYYKKPVLLIEFDPEKPFGLQGKCGIAGTVSATDFTSKLLLLTIHFPKLKLLWCSSPYATAEIFEELKAGKEQPSAAEAMKITEAISAELGVDTNYNKYNPGARDFLTLLPGVDSKNCRLLMNLTGSLAELASNWSQEQLYELLANSAAAKSLWEGFHLPPQQALTGDKDKPSTAKTGTAAKWKRKTKF